MPSSYVSSHFHIVFSTRNRERTISEKLQPKLWAYMAGIATNHGMHALAIGGMDDHIHALLSLPATMSIAKGAKCSRPILRAGSIKRAQPASNGRKGISPVASAARKFPE